jgi:hypothetical protein
MRPRTTYSHQTKRRISQQRMDAHEDHHSAHEGLFPQSWINRWPLLAIVSVILIAFAAIGHTIGGIGELARSIRDVFTQSEKVVEATGPPSVTPPRRQSVTMALATSDTVPLDGYQLIKDGSLPPDLLPGPVLPGGARTRLVLQAADPGRIAQINRISLEVQRRETSQVIAFDYIVNPRQQPGFGAAKPRRFNVVLEDSGRADVFYISNDHKTEQVPLENILPKASFPLLILDAQAGLQETLDFVLVPTRPGFYTILFKAHVMSGEEEYDLQAGPLYIVRK